MRIARLFSQIMNPKHSVHTSIDIANIRKPYKQLDEFFDIEHLVSKEPMGQFKKWFEEAAQHVEESNAFCLATATKDGIPSNRYLLMKGFDEKGFRFYTNFCSRKGKELQENPMAAMCFYWPSMSRSIRIEGRVEKLSTDETDEYFYSRPLDSQISGTISPQSQTIPNREFLLEKRKDYIENKVKIQRPASWTGCLLIPHSVEFYQGQSNRLSDRIRFRLRDDKQAQDEDPTLIHQGTDGWIYERLAP